MIICICRKISDKQICNAIRNGDNTLEDLQISLGVCIQCRKCEKSVIQLIEDNEKDRTKAGD